MIILTTISREWDRRIEKKKRGRRCNCRSFVVPFLDFPPSRYRDLGTSRRNGLKDGSKNSEAMLVTKVERKGKKECRVRASIFIKARVIYLIYNDERIGFSFLLFFFVFCPFNVHNYLVQLSNLHRRREFGRKRKNPLSLLLFALFFASIISIKCFVNLTRGTNNGPSYSKFSCIQSHEERGIRLLNPRQFEIEKIEWAKMRLRSLNLDSGFMNFEIVWGIESNALSIDFLFYLR